jgi:hypothetical protein
MHSDSHVLQTCPTERRFARVSAAYQSRPAGRHVVGLFRGSHTGLADDYVHCIMIGNVPDNTCTCVSLPLSKYGKKSDAITEAAL